MHILALGGTRFVGLHVVEAALAAGHHVDVFSRGSSPIPPGTRHMPGDRDGDLPGLDGDWEVVVDVSAYLPRQVRASAGPRRRSPARCCRFGPPSSSARTTTPTASRGGRGAVNASGPAVRTTWGEVEPFALERARGLGLDHTEVASIIRDTLAWHDAHGEATTGMDDETEAELLRAWDGR